MFVVFLQHAPHDISESFCRAFLSNAKLAREPEIPVVGSDHPLGRRIVRVAETPVGDAQLFEPRTAIQQKRDGGGAERHATWNAALLVHGYVQDAEMGEAVNARNREYK